MELQLDRGLMWSCQSVVPHRTLPGERADSSGPRHAPRGLPDLIRGMSRIKRYVTQA